MRNKKSSAQGFSLVEVTMALGVAAFALVVIVGLFPVGIGAQQTSLNETMATNIATSIIADLRQAPSAYALSLNSSLSTKSSRYGVDVTQATTTLYLDESGAKLTSSTGAHYQAKINLAPPAANVRAATYGSVAITWPPAVVTPIGSVTLFVALDRN